MIHDSDFCQLKMQRSQPGRASVSASAWSQLPSFQGQTVPSLSTLCTFCQDTKVSKPTTGSWAAAETPLGPGRAAEEDSPRWSTPTRQSHSVAVPIRQFLATSLEGFWGRAELRTCQICQEKFQRQRVGIALCRGRLRRQVAGQPHDQLGGAVAQWGFLLRQHPLQHSGVHRIC